jgi:hypothetical protein
MHKLTKHWKSVEYVFQKTSKNQAGLLCKKYWWGCVTFVYKMTWILPQQSGSSIMATLQFTGCRQSFYGGREGLSVELEHHPYSAILLPVTF